MDRTRDGAATCTLCGRAIARDDDAIVTPDFIADADDPFYRFADAALHRACFLLWEGRKAFVARYNALARHLATADGSYPHLTSEGEIVVRRGTPPT